MAETKTKKSVSKIEKNLERLYKTAIEEEKPFIFYKTLESYFQVVLKEPTLKKIVDEQIKERNNIYEKIDNLEKTAVKEMLTSKDKILAIIKDKKIDTNNFERHSTFSHEPFTNIILELEAYERGEITKGQFRSNSYESYLFDIASNLQKMGYGKELGDMAVTQENYKDYYQRINGTSGYWFAGNENGSFIFSQTWPERFMQENLLENERVFKTWGAFELLLKFHCAFGLVIKNINYWDLTEKHLEEPLRKEDFVDVALMIEDIYFLGGQTHPNSPRQYMSPNRSHELDRLNTPVFKSILQMVHNIFVQKIEAEEPESESKKISLFLNQSGELYKEPKKRYCYEMGEESDRCKIVKFLSGGGYKQTQVIANELGDKNKQTLRTEKSKINTNVKTKLNLSDFIDGKKGSGYRINPKYKVSLKKE